MDASQFKIISTETVTCDGCRIGADQIPACSCRTIQHCKGGRFIDGEYHSYGVHVHTVARPEPEPVDYLAILMGRWKDA